ncbi:hypothetical protein C8Q80DRAFT_885465 [Daedaleopsis nitida]|nr:hypothetical protein C8Q80DRAFT_885465 [Daedaleopsis nitida]
MQPHLRDNRSRDYTQPRNDRHSLLLSPLVSVQGLSNHDVVHDPYTSSSLASPHTFLQRSHPVAGGSTPHAASGGLVSPGDRMIYPTSTTRSPAVRSAQEDNLRWNAASFAYPQSQPAVTNTRSPNIINDSSGASHSRPPVDHSSDTVPTFLNQPFNPPQHGTSSTAPDGYVNSRRQLQSSGYVHSELRANGTPHQWPTSQTVNPQGLIGYTAYCDTDKSFELDVERFPDETECIQPLVDCLNRHASTLRNLRISGMLPVQLTETADRMIELRSLEKLRLEGSYGRMIHIVDHLFLPSTVDITFNVRGWEDVPQSSSPRPALPNALAIAHDFDVRPLQVKRFMSIVTRISLVITATDTIFRAFHAVEDPGSHSTRALEGKLECTMRTRDVMMPTDRWDTTCASLVPHTERFEMVYPEYRVFDGRLRRLEVTMDFAQSASTELMNMIFGDPERDHCRKIQHLTHIDIINMTDYSERQDDWLKKILLPFTRAVTAAEGRDVDSTRPPLKLRFVFTGNVPDYNKKWILDEIGFKVAHRMHYRSRCETEEIGPVEAGGGSDMSGVTPRVERPRKAHCKTLLAKLLEKPRRSTVAGREEERTRKEHILPPKARPPSMPSRIPLELEIVFSEPTVMVDGRDGDTAEFDREWAEKLASWKRWLSPYFQTEPSFSLHI